MPKAPRPTAERKEPPPPPKKRVYDIIPDGVPEAAAFLVLDKGFSVAYAAKIMHVKRNALSKHIQKFRDARQLARAKRREGSTASADSVSSKQNGSLAVTSATVPTATAAQPEAVVNKSPSAQDGAAAVQPIAETNDMLVDQVASAQSSIATTDPPTNASAQLAAIAQSQAASDASAQVAVVVQPEAAVSDSSAQVAVAAQPIATTSTLSTPKAAVPQPQLAIAPLDAAAGISFAECTCCARCQEQKKKFQEEVVI